MNDVVPNQQNLIIYNTLDGKVSVPMMARDGNVWMNQKQMAELFATSKQNVGQHISNILKENELALNSVVKNFFITAEEISVVGKEGIQMEEVSVCKESLLTVSSVAKFATVQMEGIKVRQHRTY